MSTAKNILKFAAMRFPQVRRLIESRDRAVAERDQAVAERDQAVDYMNKLELGLKRDSMEPVKGSLATGLFKRPLFDLGDLLGERARGILSPLYASDKLTKYLGKMYLDDSADTASQIHNPTYLMGYFNVALSQIEIEKQQNHTILDLGSGSGNSIGPLLELFPNSSIVASDLSVEMLSILKASLDSHGREHETERVEILQLNAEELDFSDNSFDLVTGAAVLHHLLNPEATLKRCRRILKSGGHCIFFEPFEAGYSIFGMIHALILSDRRASSLPEKLASQLQFSLKVWTDMKGSTKGPRFHGIDDKWLFTCNFFREAAKKYGFRAWDVVSVPFPPNAFEYRLKHLLMEQGFDSIPEWVSDLVREWDQFFSEEAKRDLFPEGIIVLSK